MDAIETEAVGRARGLADGVKRVAYIGDLPLASELAFFRGEQGIATAILVYVVVGSTHEVASNDAVWVAYTRQLSSIDYVFDSANVGCNRHGDLLRRKREELVVLIVSLIQNVQAAKMLCNCIINGLFILL